MQSKYLKIQDVNIGIMKVKQVLKDIGIVVLMLFVIPALNGCGPCSTADVNDNNNEATSLNSLATHFNSQAQNIEDCLNKSLTTSTPAI